MAVYPWQVAHTLSFFRQDKRVLISSNYLLAKPKESAANMHKINSLLA